MKNETSDAQRQLDKAACDTWFRAQVQASLDDPGPCIPNEEVKHVMAIKREKLRKG
ncbi:antitoxin PaaA2 family protein [Pseudomonas sp. GM79]|uniref:antitoxin PaaA2 family protein n=1 Tax=Pseudomonas sp. GM79 TaxID=1144338 RepID=UPI003083D8E1